jgi:RNA polymerase sigma-70 factor, ECF subfamily
MGSSGMNGVRTVCEDGLLISRTRQRDRDAYARLYDRHSALVYSVALRVLRNSSTAEDVLYDVFLRFWRSPEKFDSTRGNLASWLAVIARNRAIDATRRARMRIDPADVVLISPAQIESEVERNAAADKVRGLLQKMPEAQRTAVEMAFFEGMTHGEIAAATEEPPATIKTRIRSALMMIRNSYER